MYQSCFRPSVEYTIPQTFLSVKQMTIIQQKSLPLIFCKCGYNRNTHRKILFGPSDRGGAGFIPLFVKQGTEMVKHFIKHWRCHNTYTGKLLRAIVSWNQYQAGVSFSLLEDPTVALEYVQGNFLKTIRNYLKVIGGNIILDNPFVFQPLRRKDKSLMEIAISSKRFTIKQLTQINAVRMHLKVFYISEISNAAGTHIRKSYLEGNADTFYVPHSTELK